ncbi:transposase [Myxococcus sp. AB056]|uniref:transposase n=1 Tax=Myxococcus sp. AB056 TaxID=2562792 RepID=UPI0034CDDFCE
MTVPWHSRERGEQSSASGQSCSFRRYDPLSRPKRAPFTRSLTPVGLLHDFSDIRQGIRVRHITPRIARRGIESSERLGRYRWVVERTLAWLHSFKRLRVREERRADLHLALLQLGCCIVLLRRVGRRL